MNAQKICGFALLVFAIAQAAAEDDESFFNAAVVGNLTRLEAETENLDRVDPRSGLTAWQIAKVNRRDEAADLLLHNGADPKVRFPHPAEVLAKYLDAHEQPDTPGVAVLVSKGGQIVFAGGYGLANLKTGEKIGAETVFRIGSITKQFAATALLLLVDEGKLALDDKLSKFYPDWPRGDEITVHQLLTHTSGMTSFTSLPNFAPYEPTTADEVIATFKNQPQVFEPGTEYQYNNSGYFLVGEIASEVAGKPYQQLLKERIFDAAGMKRTGAHRPELDLEPEARGYLRGSEGESWELPDQDWHMSHAGAAGEFYATIGDLHRWNEAIFNGAALKPETRAAAHRPGGIEPDSDLVTKENLSYGYGWVADDFQGLHMIWHNGGFPGFYAKLTRFPEHEMTVVALSNSSPPPSGFNPDEVTKVAASLWLWEAMETQPSFRSNESEMTEEDLAEFVGTFDFGGIGVMRFRAEDGGLHGKLAAQGWNELVSMGEDVWQFPAVGAKFTFSRNDKGAVTAVRLEQGGLDINGARFDEPEAGELSREQLLDFEGKFKRFQAGDFVFRVDGNDRLLGRLGSQQEFVYTPVEGVDDRVFSRAIRAEIQFERGDDGAVSALTLHQGGAKIRWERDSPREDR